MKRLLIILGGILITVLIMLASCSSESESNTITETETVEHQDGTVESASSCVSCHSDKELLVQTATAITEEKSEATTGEG